MVTQIIYKSVYYGGSEVIESSELLSLNRTLLKIKLRISEYSTLNLNGTYIPTPSDSAFLAKDISLLSSVVNVTYTDKNNKITNLGEFKIEFPSYEFVRLSDNKGEIFLYFYLPITKQFFEMLRINWTKGKMNINIKKSFGFLPDNNNLMNSIILKGEGMNICYKKPNGDIVTDFPLEEDTLEKLASLYPLKPSLDGVFQNDLDNIYEYLRKNDIESATITLRNLIMNKLTVLDKSKPGGKQRFIDPKITDNKLVNYDEDLRVFLKERIEENVQKILDNNLEILHKFVKDDKIRREPIPSLLFFVYNNIINLLEFLEIDEILKEGV